MAKGIFFCIKPRKDQEQNWQRLMDACEAQGVTPSALFNTMLAPLADCIKSGPINGSQSVFDLQLGYLEIK